ncbi:hypothetical protein CONPUDRAFT_68649 [Coniophora puteana RWD-64-598 SS2]|uniref:Uncharacterized protein n=1 Tax=Coniophora puteana (strain RWD-64-598) TaxID=741705 RepID=A0A5M3N595_CONPW|nr:uncharacterized protein CONPUDRAFT_68649 [Coniophora puteana RWD-64-598 SS2]EIW86025.1 hypothetical protein CONPUDRAFT_68649 [Coniophora puteana RWD-64-598 SS2]
MSVIERPDDEIYRFLLSHSTRRSDILVGVRLRPDQWDELMTKMRPVVEEVLDRSIPFSQQSEERIALVIDTARDRLEFVREYQDAWPALLYTERNISIHLRHQEERRRANIPDEDGSVSVSEADADSIGTLSSASESRSPSPNVSDVELVSVWDPADHLVDYGLWRFLKRDCVLDLTGFAGTFARLGVPGLLEFDALIWERGGARFNEFMENNGIEFGFTEFEMFLFKLAVGKRQRRRVH